MALHGPRLEADYRIVLFDYVGSGRSDLRAYNADRYSNLNGYAQDVLDICETLDLRDAIFVGHSVSAMIGLLAALKTPERFSCLIMLGPSPCYINDPPDYHGGFNRTDIVELIDTMQQNYIGWASFLGPSIMKNPDRPAAFGRSGRAHRQHEAEFQRLEGELRSPPFPDGPAQPASAAFHPAPRERGEVP